MVFCMQLVINRPFLPYMFVAQTVGQKSIHNPLAISGSTQHSCRGDHHLEMSLGALFPSLHSSYFPCIKFACKIARLAGEEGGGIYFAPWVIPIKGGPGLRRPSSSVEKAAAAAASKASSCSSAHPPVRPSIRLPAPLVVCLGCLLRYSIG